VRPLRTPAPRWVLLLLPLALVGLGFAARSLASGALSAFMRYETPFGMAGGAAPPLVPLSRQVVVVLVDGLGLEPSRGLPFLNELRGRGADYTCRIGLPSLSLPGRAVMLTGAWQEVHGQPSNYNPRRLKVEHLFGTARRAGRTTALAAGANAHRLFEPHVAHAVEFPEEPESAPFEHYAGVHRRQGDAALALLRDRRPDLAFLELHAVDEAGHGWGATSAEYRAAAALADDELRRIVQALDLAQATLVVTADHGHVPAGGHGGPEAPVMEVPLVMTGAGVRAGARGAASQVDLAPTLAALLGVAVPASNQGRPLLDALTLDAAGRVAVLQAVASQREAFVSRYVQRVRTLDGDPEPAGAHGPGAAGPPAEIRSEEERGLLARLAELDLRAEREKAQRMDLEARVRSRRSLAGVFAAAFVLAALWRLGAFSGRELGRAAAFAGVAVVLYHVLLPAAGIGYSITAVNKDEWLPGFFRKDMALGIACCGAAIVGLGLWARREGGWLPWDLARQAWLLTAVFCFVFVLKIAAVYWRHGVFMRWHVPDQYWSFGFYLDVLVVMAVGFAAPVLPLLAWAVGRRRA
jgi:2,3-bisphosphoglycerate-independent phosphoglycerate mutase